MKRRGDYVKTGSTRERRRSSQRDLQSARSRARASRRSDADLCAVVVARACIRTDELVVGRRPSLSGQSSAFLADPIDWPVAGWTSTFSLRAIQPGEPPGVAVGGLDVDLLSQGNPAGRVMSEIENSWTSTFSLRAIQPVRYWLSLGARWTSTFSLRAIQPKT